MSDAAPSPGTTHPEAGENPGHLRTLDLHDETGQLLTAILVNLQHLSKHTRAPELGETVRDTQRLVESLFYAIRNYVREASGGRPVSSLPAPDLVPAIERLAGDFSRRTGIEVELSLDPDIERVPRPHKAIFYRVVQEALTNVIRHSSAGKVAIRASRSGEGASVEVADDGGSRPGPPRRPGTAPAPGGTGIRGMRERVRLAGGECTVELVKDRGVTVRVVLPYNVS